MDRRLKYSEHSKKLILVVDDESINRQMLGYIVSSEYEVVYAENGVDALEKIHTFHDTLSMILLDLLMPGMDGFELLEILKSDESLRQIPVIVLTSEKAAEVKSLKLGAADFITKPYDMPEVILARIGRIIELAEDRMIIRHTERDELTGLYTKDYFMEYCAELDQYYPDWEMDAVAVDIEHFHLVNELHGRYYGDRVLSLLADTLREVLSSDADGYVCRYEADMFYMYCTHMESYEKMEQRIAEALKDMLHTDRIRVRYGVYPKVDRSVEMAQRFDRAKLACNRIRNNFMQSIAYYDTEIHDASIFEEKLIQDIRGGLERGDLIVYYQPKYNVQGDKPVLASAEALIRWKHPELGMISPGAFIPLFEKNGLIQLLDHYVWEKAAEQIHEWKMKYGRSVQVSVNVSRIDLYEPKLENRLLGILDKYMIEPSDYLLEVTESAYAEDSGQLIDVVSRLRSCGFRVEMDDFGSGYSSLNMLTALPIDALKMDMKFVRHVHEDVKSQRMIELVIEIADYLSVPVVAEGVEEEEQVQILKDAGCQIIQGYYFSRPLPPEEFEKLLQGS
ncbi:MAG: EAL domain-containing protein [Lachnospiraceae bacterium]|nr:EAL domain-containing protein [Lachnospiraceae bacterium]